MHRDLCRLSEICRVRPFPLLFTTLFLGFFSLMRYRLRAAPMGIELPTWSTTPTTISFSDGMHGDAVAKFMILMIVLVDLPSGHLT